MPSLSIYIKNDVYAKLLASRESPSVLVKRLLEEYFAKAETPARFQILKIKFGDWASTPDAYFLLDKSKPKDEEFVMQSHDKKELEAYIEKAKGQSNKKQRRRERAKSTN